MVASVVPFCQILRILTESVFSGNKYLIAKYNLFDKTIYIKKNTFKMSTIL